MISTTSGSLKNVEAMVTYFEKKREHTVETASSRKRRSIEAIMSLNRRPWEHFPRRKSSASTDRSRRSSTSTRSNSTTYDPAEEYISKQGYAASERSTTSTVVSEGRRPSENPDYDWEHDSIGDLKASLKKIDLSATTNGSTPKGSDATKELHVVVPLGLDESKSFSNGTPGVHEIDFVDPSAPRTAEIEPVSEAVKEKSLAPTEPVEQVEATNSETQRSVIDKDELAKKSVVPESKVSETAHSSQQFVEARIPPRMSSAAAAAKATQLKLRVKTSTHSEKDRKSNDATSPGSPPNTPPPNSKSRPKLALDLPGIPESEAETLVRNRRPSLSMVQRLPAQRQQQAAHVNKSSSRPPPVSLSRFPVRSISAPLPGQEQIAPPKEMMELVNRRQIKFNDIRDEKLRRLSSINGGSRQASLMGRRHASAPVSEEAAAESPSSSSSPRKRQRRRSGPVRLSFMQRLSISHRFSVSQRRQSVSQAIKGYVRLPRRRPSWLMMRTRSKER